MIDQDYADLLNLPPPSGDVLEWTFSTRKLATAFVSILLGTPALCLGVYYGMGQKENDDLHLHGGAVLRVPTFNRLSMDSPGTEIFAAGMHLAAVLALPLFWCVRLAHRQRLQARTGIARYDVQTEGAVHWVSAAWMVGFAGAGCLFIAVSTRGARDEDSSSPGGLVRIVLFALAALGFIGQAACTSWALQKARRVFVVSDADLASYRRKTRLACSMVAAAVVAVVSVVVIERFVDRALWMGAEEKKRDCDVEWCYSRSVMGLWEWIVLLLEVCFCLTLRHDLAPATGGVGVESFVL